MTADGAHTFRAAVFKANYEKSDCGPQWAALFDVALIILIFLMLGSNFVVAPGVGIDLQGDAAKLEIPVIKGTQPLDGVPVDAAVSVLNIRGNSMIIFNGKIWTPENFAAEMKNADMGGRTLLIKMDKDVDAQTFLNVCRIAKEAGFKRAQIAAKPSTY